MTSGPTTCPTCGEEILRPAREGGTLLRNQRLHITADGQLIVTCPGRRCDAEYEVLKGVVLRLRLRTPLTPTRSGSNDGTV